MAKWVWMSWTAGCLLLASCEEATRVETSVVAEVGTYQLTKPMLRAALPAGLTGDDSIAATREYVRQWVDEHLLYVQGLAHVQDLRQIDEQVEAYRRMLVARTYENQLLETQVGEVTDDACWNYYEAHAAELKLSHPILQGLYIKLPASAAGLDKLRRWMKGLEEGDSRNVEEIEAYCYQRAVAYDNFFHDWVALGQIVASVPASTEEVQSFLSRKGRHEVADTAFVYLVFIKDYRIEGGQQPYEYARPGIREILRKERLAARRTELRQRLFDEGVRDGIVKIHP